MGIEKFGISY